MVSLALQNVLSVTRERTTTTRSLRLHVSHVLPVPMLTLARRPAPHARLGRSMKTPIQKLNAPLVVMASTAQLVRHLAQIVQQEELIWTPIRLPRVTRAAVVNTHLWVRLSVLTVRLVPTQTKGQRQNAETVE